MAHRPLPEVVQVGGRPAEGELTCPPWLDEAGAEFWKDAVGRLTEAGVIDRVDGPVLELMAVQWSYIQSARAVTREYGFFTRGSNGQIREHPSLKIEREATALFLKMAEQYALTPVARTRLGLAGLQARSLAAEMDSALNAPVGSQEPISDAEVVSDESDVGLPGV